VVHGVAVATCFFSRLPAIAVVVTTTVVRSIAHPVWHVAQGPGVVIVGVVGQHGSLGGTKSVVVSRMMHSGIGPQVDVGQAIINQQSSTRL
jgi:hypothetical protein